MIIDTIFGKAKIIMPGFGNTVYVRLLDWSPKHIKSMGGEKEAWILISETQILTKGLFKK